MGSGCAGKSSTGTTPVVPITPATQPEPASPAKAAALPGPPAKKAAASPSVAVIYYSLYGHILTMAREMKKALEKSGVNVDLFQVQETLPQEVLSKMGAPPKPDDVMTITHDFIQELPQYDGFMFGIPTRFGSPAGQMKAFFDGTGKLWQSGALAGKLAASFVSTGTQNGGQETTHMTAITNLVHHGMVFVPLGYQAGDVGQFSMDQVHGGSPWGASTLAGADGSRTPSEAELTIASRQAEKFGEKVKRSVSSPSTRSLKVAIVYYTMYGHIKKLADEIAESVRGSGIQVDLFQAPELLPEEVLQKMGAPPKPSDPVMDYSLVGTLPEYDGIMFGIPTRFGNPASQMKAFFDSTGQLWQAQSLAGKPFATFVSTGTQNGGQETTHFTALTNLVHQGMIYVPLGYQAGGDGQFEMGEVHGGSPWGASTLAGADGSRQPSEIELKIARKQGEVFAAKVKQLAA